MSWRWPRWSGRIVFFTFVVAPIIFRVLGAEAGGRFVRALFPRYYLWNAILGAIALPAFVAGPLVLPRVPGDRRWASRPSMLLAIILIMLYGGNSLVPQINRARDDGPVGARSLRPAASPIGPAERAGDGRWDRVCSSHSRAVPLPAPGIIELSPVERARRAAGSRPARAADRGGCVALDPGAAKD